MSKRLLAPYAYRVSVGPGISILAGLVSLALAWATVAFQTLKAARSNPADSLRCE